jgi:polyferredoxin
MGPGLIVTAGGWAGCLSCAVVAISGYAQMGRRKGGWREGTAWTAPLVFTSAAVMLLVVLGALALIPWLILALVPLVVIAASAALAWAEIARRAMRARPPRSWARSPP